MNKMSWIFVILCAVSGCHRSPSPDELKWDQVNAMYEKVYGQDEVECSDFVTTGELVEAIGEPEAVVQFSELPAFFAERLGYSSEANRTHQMKLMCLGYRRYMRLSSDSSYWRDYPGLGESKVWFYLLRTRKELTCAILASIGDGRVTLQPRKRYVPIIHKSAEDAFC